MRISVTNVERIRILSCTGELSLGEAADSLEKACDDALDAGARQILLDLRRLAWLDSAGVGAVVSCGTHAEKRAAVLKIAVTADGPVRRIFKATCLDQRFELFEDVDAAVTSFAS